MGSHRQSHNYSGLFCLRVPWNSHKAAKAWLPAQLVGKSNQNLLEATPRRPWAMWNTSWWKTAGQGPVALSSSASFGCNTATAWAWFDSPEEGGISPRRGFYKKLGFCSQLLHKTWQLAAQSLLKAFFFPSCLCPYHCMHIMPGTPERNQGRKRVWLGNLSNVNILHPGALLSGKRGTFCTRLHRLGLKAKTPLVG